MLTRSKMNQELEDMTASTHILSTLNGFPIKFCPDYKNTNTHTVDL